MRSPTAILGDRIGIDNMKTGGQKRVTGDLNVTIEGEIEITKAVMKGLIVTLGDRTEIDVVRTGGMKRATRGMNEIEDETKVDKARAEEGSTVKQEEKTETDNMKTGGMKKVTRDMTGMDEVVTIEDRIGTDEVLEIGMKEQEMTDDTVDRVERMILGRQKEERALESLGKRNAKNLRKTGTRASMRAGLREEMIEDDKMRDRQTMMKDVVIGNPR